eukprot:TRINITY_DN801_c0_g1_i19.p1 TRINITY_DN801_c0_g1~~TRINITY_DN801_c0_g1_i19.p1  ORF type:complete len:242 (+),score=25.14 TRINITY_DN801_c0_g1_i19:285-1010(+)
MQRAISLLRSAPAHTRHHTLLTRALHTERVVSRLSPSVSSIPSYTLTPSGTGYQSRSFASEEEPPKKPEKRPPRGFEQFYRDDQKVGNKAPRPSVKDNMEGDGRRDNKKQGNYGRPGQDNDPNDWNNSWRKKLMQLGIGTMGLATLLALTTGGGDGVPASSFGMRSQEITFQEFASQLLPSGQVERVVVNQKSVVHVHLRNPATLNPITAAPSDARGHLDKTDMHDVSIPCTLASYCRTVS